MTRYSGRTVVVTGASKGLGRGIALRLADEGANLAICARSVAPLEETAAECRWRGAQVMALPCDVTDRAEVERFTAQAAGMSGRIDALVLNAAAMVMPLSLEDHDDAMWHNTLTGGVTSAYYGLKAALPYMRQAGGRIVTMTSTGGWRGVKGSGAYATAKTALIGLTRVVANEWGQYGITANCVMPMGLSDSWQQLLDQMPEGTNPFDALGVRRNALGYAGDPECDVAPMVAFLCSEEARYVTGAIIPVDGGLNDLE